ncbi:MAG: hypothetical protein ABFD79_16525 [Phycisphaerales bacterium]
MKNYILILCLFGFLLIVGCKQKKEIELTQDNFPEFRNLKLTKFYIMTISHRGYGYEFYIDDLKKADVIRLCIYQAKKNEYDNERFQKDKQTQKNEDHEILYFETKDAIYTMRIGWNDEFVYGYWWESAPLLKVFKKWQLFEELSKADPAWPVFLPKYSTSDTNTVIFYEANESEYIPKHNRFQPPSHNENAPPQSDSNEGGLVL